MKSYYNSKPEFGESGPFEAESKQALADELMPIIEQWASERSETTEECMEKIKELRESFIAGLREVIPANKVWPEKSLAERLNFSTTKDDDRAVKIERRKDIAYYDTLCLYCANNDIRLDTVSNHELDGAVFVLESYGKDALDIDHFYFWID